MGTRMPSEKSNCKGSRDCSKTSQTNWMEVSKQARQELNPRNAEEEADHHQLHPRTVILRQNLGMHLHEPRHAVNESHRISEELLFPCLGKFDWCKQAAHKAPLISGLLTQQ